MNLNVVFHLDLNEPKRLNIAMDNVANYLNYLADVPDGGKAAVVVVANGPAVNLFVKGENPEQEIRAKVLMANGMSVRCCSNALRKFKIDPASLWEGCEATPGGIPELITLQNEGYSYIKP